MEQPMQENSAAAGRQKAVGSLNQRLELLTGESEKALELARSVAYKLLGQAKGDNAPPEFDNSKSAAELARPLFLEIENTISKDLGRIREISDILTDLDNEIS